jgi:acetyl esterase/lipase
MTVGDEDEARRPVIRLWPSGPPLSIAGVGPEARFEAPAADGVDTAMLRNVSDASLTVFQPAPGKVNGTGVIVAPGGAWLILAWEYEGLDLARWLAARGFTAFLLKYRLNPTPPDPADFNDIMAEMNSRLSDTLPAAQAPRALAEMMGDEAAQLAREVAAEDGRRALQLVRDGAADWGVRPDRVGMIGFSAGAFLTVDVAMGGAPLAFAGAIYGGETRGRPIPPDAPPLFAAVAQDDRLLFKIVEGLYADWSNADRQAELHVFNRGGHGFGMTQRGLPVERWGDLFGAWLSDLGFA